MNHARRGRPGIGRDVDNAFAVDNESTRAEDSVRQDHIGPGEYHHDRLVSA